MENCNCGNIFDLNTCQRLVELNKHYSDKPRIIGGRIEVFFKPSIKRYTDTWYCDKCKTITGDTEKGMYWLGYVVATSEPWIPSIELLKLIH